MVKNYRLVAWTDKGKAKMVPELGNAYLQEFIDNVARAGAGGSLVDEIMALEAYGDALRECDRMVDALEQYRRAAFKCLCCDDINWADSDYGFILTRPYSGHFYRIFGKCRELLSEDPRLRDTAAAKKLLEYYDDVDAAHQKIRTELDDVREISKAWGRRP